MIKVYLAISLVIQLNQDNVYTYMSEEVGYYKWHGINTKPKWHNDNRILIASKGVFFHRTQKGSLKKSQNEYWDWMRLLSSGVMQVAKARCYHVVHTGQGFNAEALFFTNPIYITLICNTYTLFCIKHELKHSLCFQWQK